MNDLIKRLRARTVPLWTHATCGTPVMHGHKPDPLCQEAAAEIERKSDAIQRLWRERDELRAAMVTERARLRVLVEAVRDANREAEDADTFRLLKPGQERAWMALLAEVEAPNVRANPAPKASGAKRVGLESC